MIKKIENHYIIEIEINKNMLDIDYNHLFQFATRNNEKRKFLFVSNVLGKHISVKPENAILIGKLLGLLYAKSTITSQDSEINDSYDEVIDEIKSTFLKDASNEKSIRKNDIINYSTEIPGKATVIAFAETATSLGHIVFDTFKDGYAFYHTTREQIQYDGNIIKFEEEHSHATSHLVYENQECLISSSENIILVDDEISTGNTILNIIKSLKSSYNISKYSVLTIMDLRNQDSIDKFKIFEEENGIEIDVISIVKGQIINVENLELSSDDIKNHDIFKKNVIVENSGNFIKKIEIGEFTTTGNKHNKYLDSTGRFGVSGKYKTIFDMKIKNASDIVQEYVSEKTLILGTEEFMYIPLMISSNLSGDISYKSTTRSPIYPCKGDDYLIKSGLGFRSLYNRDVDNFVYNLEEEKFDTVIVIVENAEEKLEFEELNNLLSGVSKNVYFVILSGEEKSIVNYPTKMGSYDEDDVVFLLKDISDKVEEQDNDERELAIQRGIHYSEMLPIEYRPTEKYLEIFHSSLNLFSVKLAEAVAITSEKILKVCGKKVVLVSLARAGTPAGILIKRYIKYKYNLSVPHYSVSIIRGMGIDENAIKFILNNHPDHKIQFVDGWTGKGAITNELIDAVNSYKDNHGENDNLSSELAVLADPGNAVRIYGTKEDFLIPNACLNSTISGLLSRTFYRDDIIGLNDYHGAKFYQELLDEDLSNYYIDVIEKEFENVEIDNDIILNFDIDKEIVSWSGLQDVKNIEKDFDIESIHFIKPGIGETTRVLLRRIPWKILVSEDAKNIEHVLQLAKEKNIEVERYPLKAYNCCGIVKSLKGE